MAKIFNRGLQQILLVFEAAKAMITVLAKKSSYLASSMIVVDVEAKGPGIESLGRISTDGAASILLGEFNGIFIGRNTIQPFGDSISSFLSVLRFRIPAIGFGCVAHNTHITTIAITRKFCNIFRLLALCANKLSFFQGWFCRTCFQVGLKFSSGHSFSAESAGECTPPAPFNRSLWALGGMIDQLQRAEYIFAKTASSRYFRSSHVVKFTAQNNFCQVPQQEVAAWPCL